MLKQLLTLAVESKVHSLRYFTLVLYLGNWVLHSSTVGRPYLSTINALENYWLIIYSPFYVPYKYIMMHYYIFSYLAVYTVIKLALPSAAATLKWCLHINGSIPIIQYHTVIQYILSYSDSFYFWYLKDILMLRMLDFFYTVALLYLLN